MCYKDIYIFVLSNIKNYYKLIFFKTLKFDICLLCFYKLIILIKNRQGKQIKQILSTTVKKRKNNVCLIKLIIYKLLPTFFSRQTVVSCLSFAYIVQIYTEDAIV